MYRSLALILAVAWAPAVLARDPAEIRKSQRLEVAAATADLPLEGEILKGFARALGVELRVTPAGSTTGALQALADGRADLAAGGLVSQRDQRPGLGFSSEVFPTRFVAVNRAPAEAPSFIESLRGANRILAPAASGAGAAVAAAKLPGFKTDTGATPDKALASLRTEAGSVAVLGLLDALGAKRTDPELQLGVLLGDRQSVAFAVRHADAGLLAAINGHLGQLRTSPSYRALIARSLGQESLQILARSRLDATP